MLPLFILIKRIPLSHRYPYADLALSTHPAALEPMENKNSSTYIPPRTQLPPNQIPATQMPPNQIPQGQIPPGQIPPGQIPATQIPPNQMSTNPINTHLGFSPFLALRQNIYQALHRGRYFDKHTLFGTGS